MLWIDWLLSFRGPNWFLSIVVDLQPIRKFLIAIIVQTNLNSIVSKFDFFITEFTVLVLYVWKYICFYCLSLFRCILVCLWIFNLLGSLLNLDPLTFAACCSSSVAPKPFISRSQCLSKVRLFLLFLSWIQGKWDQPRFWGCGVYEESYYRWGKRSD